MAQQVDRLNSQKILNAIVSWGTRILFIIAIVVLAVLSFVQKFEFAPDVKKITTVALIGVALNWLVWDSYYQQQYEKTLTLDIANKEYCIHKRYYEARKDWTYKELQDKIRKYNEDFREAWIQDIEDITGRKRDEIVKGEYKGNTHKFLIWRLKHKKYPKSGIRTPNDVLYILSVGKADSMRIHTKAEQKYHTAGRVKKLVMSVLGCLLAVSFAYEFIKGDYTDAVILLVLNVAMLFTSLFFGATSGLKGGKLRLSTAEIVSEKLEEWRHQKPAQEPFKTKEEPIVENESVKSESSIEIV